MSINKFEQHVIILVEDRHTQEIATGFKGYLYVDPNQIDMRSPSGGYSKVRNYFEEVYVKHLRNCPKGNVVMFADFDGRPDDHPKSRLAYFEEKYRKIFEIVYS
jgi:hypothetical protein